MKIIYICKNYTIKIKNLNDIESQINQISYFQGHLDIYGYKEMAVIPNLNYDLLKSTAESPFYQSLKFGFGDDNSFCTDYVHDVLKGGGLSSIQMSNGLEVIDISAVVGSSDYRSIMRKVLTRHNKNPMLLEYRASEPELLTAPLPINIAIQLRKKYPKFNP